MNNNPLYSVIIPHYNSPELLVRCLASIPDREDIQVLIVDDNSSVQIVDFAHFPGSERRYTEIIYNKENKGAGHARNLALPHARGEWLLFADADDYFADDAWSTFDKIATGTADVFYFNIQSRDGQTGEVLHDRGDIYIINLEKYLLTRDKEWEYRLRFWNNTPWGKLIRRRLVAQNAITFEETRYANDALFSTRVALSAQTIDATNVVCYCVTKTAGSLTQIQSLEALTTRYEVCLRKNLLLRENGFAKYETPINSFFKAMLTHKGKGFMTFCRLTCRYRGAVLRSLYWFFRLRIKHEK